MHVLVCSPPPQVLLQLLQTLQPPFTTNIKDYSQHLTKVPKQLPGHFGHVSSGPNGHTAIATSFEISPSVSLLAKYCLTSPEIMSGVRVGFDPLVLGPSIHVGFEIVT